MPRRSPVALTGVVVAGAVGALSMVLAASALVAAPPAPATAADVCAASAMLAYEQQAVQIAQVAQQRPSLDARARSIADVTVRDVPARVHRWRAWLAAHPGVDDEAGGTAVLSGHDHGHTTAVVGVACAGEDPAALQQQLTELASLSGSAGTVRFAEIMLSHDEGAIARAGAAVFDGQDDTVRLAAQRALDILSARATALKGLLRADG